MSDITDITKVEGLSEVANNLINKISGAIGWRTTSSTKKIAIETYIDEVQKSNLAPIEKAALISNAGKIIKEYSNQANIVKKAIPLLSSEANSDAIDGDWIAAFMDKARLISDEEFQLIWAKILAEETNEPGSISLRTLETLKSLSKKEAILFQQYAKRAVYDGKQAFILTKLYGLSEDFGEILEMEDSGLMSSQQVESSLNIPDTKEILVFHDRKACCFMKSKKGTEKFKFNAYMFTKAGFELLKAIDIEQDEDILVNYLKSVKALYEEKIIIKLYEIERIDGNVLSYKKDVDFLHDQVSVVSLEEESR